jgi:hypothetical protein
MECAGVASMMEPKTMLLAAQLIWAVDMST